MVICYIYIYRDFKRIVSVIRAQHYREHGGRLPPSGVYDVTAGEMSDVIVAGVVRVVNDVIIVKGLVTS